MTTVQEQYTSAVRQTQETWAGIVDSVTDTLQKSTIVPGRSTGLFDPTAAIDQIFDFWGKALDVQREAAKQLAGVTLSLGDQVRSQAESVGTAVREQAESAKRLAREQVEVVEAAEREQARAAQAAEREKAAEQREKAARQREKLAQKYEDYTKVELQEELAGRDLPKTGNVDELRDRLIADDQK